LLIYPAYTFAMGGQKKSKARKGAKDLVRWLMGLHLCEALRRRPEVPPEKLRQLEKRGLVDESEGDLKLSAKGRKILVKRLEP
jgi:hypothetical protein